MSKRGKEATKSGSSTKSRTEIEWNLLETKKSKEKKEETTMKSEYWAEEEKASTNTKKGLSANGVPLGRKATPWAQKPENKDADDLLNQVTDALNETRTTAKNSRPPRRATDDDLSNSINTVIRNSDGAVMQNVKAEISARLLAQRTMNEAKKEKVKSMKAQLNFDSDFKHDSHSTFLTSMAGLTGRNILKHQLLFEVVGSILDYKSSIDETMHPELRDYRLLMDSILRQEMTLYTNSNALGISQEIDDGMDDGFEVEEEEVQPAKKPKTNDVIRPNPSSSSSSSSSSGSAGYSRIIPSASAESATNKVLSETASKASAFGNLDDYEED